jgi:Cupredoxin-like domain
VKAIVMAGLLLVVVGCSQPGETPVAASTSPTTATTDGPSATAVDATEIIVRDFTLDPIDVRATAGTVDLAVSNEGPTVHNVAIRDDGGKVLGSTRDLRTGESEVISPDIPAGSYILFCSLPGHESLGIKGTLAIVP